MGVEEGIGSLAEPNIEKGVPTYSYHHFSSKNEVTVGDGTWVMTFILNPTLGGFCTGCKLQNTH
jgi:hypothetical protein